MPEPLDLESRRRLFEYLEANPGTHMRELERALGMSTGMLTYHLDYLERAGLIRVEDAGYRKHYFVAAQFRPDERSVIALLRQPTPRRILIALLTAQSLSFQELLATIGVAKSTLSFHLHKLTTTNLVTVRRQEREHHYAVGEPDRVARLLIAIRESVADDAVERFVALWTKLRPQP